MIDVLICTFGLPVWQTRGQAALHALGVGLGKHYHMPDGTLAEVRNWAAAEAEGPWLVFLDADDRLGPGYLDRMREAILRADGEPALYVPRLALGPGAAAWPNRSRSMRETNHCCIGTCILRADMVEAGGFREWPAYEDWDLFLRIHLGLRRPLVYVDAVYEATYSPTGRNSQEPAVLQAAYEGIRKANGLA